MFYNKLSRHFHPEGCLGMEFNVILFNHDSLFYFKYKRIITNTIKKWKFLTPVDLAGRSKTLRGPDVAWKSWVADPCFGSSFGRLTWRNRIMVIYYRFRSGGPIYNIDVIPNRSLILKSDSPEAKPQLLFNKC